MAIVNDRHNANKPQQVDPKTGKVLPPTVPARASSPSLDQMGLGESNNAGFFGSFFAPKNKKKMAAMESPPPQLKASGTLSEKEMQEVEVISKQSSWSIRKKVFAFVDVFIRTSHQLVFQHRPPHNDRHGSQSHHAYSSSVSPALLPCLHSHLAKSFQSSATNAPTINQTHQRRDAARATREHVPYQRIR